METYTYNVLISSKHKKELDTNNIFEVKLQDTFFKMEAGEEMYVCMTQFHTIKTFYACQTGLNDTFQIITRNQESQDETVDTYTIPQGNYNVKTFMDELIKITKSIEDLFQISYDAKVNRYVFKNLFNSNFEVYIKSINAGVLLGLDDGIEYQVTAQGTYSSNFVNLSGYTSLVIKIDGDLNINNSVSNIEDDKFRYEKVLAILSINDKAPMDSITYENDNCLFKHRVNMNKENNAFKIRISNEDGILLADMSDWIMTLKFEKVRKVNQYAMIEKLLSNLNFYLGSLYLYLELPTSITWNDLITNK